ncbi:NiFe hydrogenase small subunit HydA [Alteromonadaceae bacterium 2753L.S.0a.02]|nr:NiFe hydrogenase small subunit HydA [Alteromonadaceae bacterium 2753L.S.0a.02]
MNRKKNLLWLQSGGCGGCSMSLLNSEQPGLTVFFEAAGIELLWHPSLSESCNDDLITLLHNIIDDKISLDILCLEGAVIHGPKGTGAFHHLSNTQQPMRDWLKKLSQKAKNIIAVGSCAAFGGITAGGGNPTEASGLQFSGEQAGALLSADYKNAQGLPVINIAGCPTHPGWITDTLFALARNELSMSDLDTFNRPRFYSDQLVHHGCPRNEYYEYKASAEKPSDLGCMMEHLGCRGTQAHADCNTRLWNGSGSCLRGGYACINCTAPQFEEPGYTFTLTPKVAGIPTGLPTDMPKAWFVALSALAKAATPQRLKNNAVEDHVRTPPEIDARKKP